VVAFILAIPLWYFFVSHGSDPIAALEAPSDTVRRDIARAREIASNSENGLVSRAISVFAYVWKLTLEVPSLFLVLAGVVGILRRRLGVDSGWLKRYEEALRSLGLELERYWPRQTLGPQFSLATVKQVFHQRYTHQREIIIMGDVFAGIHNSTVINKSFVKDAFNKVQSEVDQATADALLKVAEEVGRSGNQEAGQLLDQFNEELAKPQPRKGLLKRSWDALVQVLPTVSAIAGAAGAIARLYS
jgi:hypothetical protein